MTLDLRGLDQFKASSLVAAGDAALATAPRMALDRIDYDPEQPRRGLDPVALRELAASIRLHGVLEPVSLRPHPQDPQRFIVNRGERRCRASQLAGLTQVPYFLDDRLDRFAQVVENLQREDLSPFDLAHFIAEREREGLSRAEIARRLQKPRSFITEAASLTQAPPELRAAFDAGRVRDTRVLYTLLRLHLQDPAGSPTRLQGAHELTREQVDAWRSRPERPASAPSPAADAQTVLPVTSPRPSRAAPAVLRVTYQGRSGYLTLKPTADEARGLVWLEGDVIPQEVALAELQLVAWGREIP